MAQTYQVHKALRIAAFIWLSLLISAVITTFVLLLLGISGLNDLSTNADILINISVAFMFATIVFSLILGTIYSYYSWQLNAEDFLEWHIEQQIFSKKWARNHYGKSPSRTLWSARLGAMAQIGIGLVIIGWIGYLLYFVSTINW